MIKSFKEIYDRLVDKKPVSLAVVNPKSEYLLEALSEAENRGWISSIKVDDPSIAVAMVKDGNADLIMKGDIDTASILKAVLDSENGIKTSERLSHIAVVESPNYDKLLLFTDGGVNVDQSQEVLESMIKNGISLANSLGNQNPRIAMLSLVEKVSEKVPETVVANELAEKFKNFYKIEGPIALDVALRKEASEAKNINSDISGETDIFVGPTITTTNFVVKALGVLGNAKVGGIILGAKVPIVLLSRSDSMETKLHSIALGVSLV